MPCDSIFWKKTVNGGRDKMKEIIDDMGRKVAISDSTKRIVSLCPSITETLYALGLEERIVGRTKYCIHPAEQIKGATLVGGTKDVDFKMIQDLQPDLIITDKEETPRGVAEELMERYNVFIFDVQTYENALHMIKMLGKITDCEKKSTELIQSIEKEFALLPKENNKKVIYFIWRKPYMAAGRNTFIHSIISKCGFINVIATREERYPEITIEEIEKLQPDILFLSSEPFPFADQHKEELQKLLPNVKIILVDGEYFSWYGARMEAAGRYLQQMI